MTPGATEDISKPPYSLTTIYNKKTKFDAINKNGYILCCARRGKKNMMNLLRNKEAKRQTKKVKIDTEYYSTLQCKEYLLEAVAKVVVDESDDASKVARIAAILQIQIPPEFEEGYIGEF